MSAELFLELGDIIKINAPSNSLIHERIYFIDYIDENIIYLIDDTTFEKISFNIDENGNLNDESIETIEILNRSEHKGYALQNDLIIDKWVSIHMRGDIPTIITGKITNLEEDMIEVTVFQSNEKIYIDFGYQGLDSSIEKISLRDPPQITTLIQEEETEEAVKGDVEDDVEDDVAVRIKEFIIEADEIEFGEELEEITELVNVPIEERRYDVESQKNDILDDLLSTIPVSMRNKQKINEIHKMIERFIQLRDKFSVFHETNLTLSKLDPKPLLKNISNIEKRFPLWILPIVRNKKKIYNILDDDEEEFAQDVDNRNFKEDIKKFIDEFPLLRKRNERSKDENIIPEDLNRYDQMLLQINNFFSPFTRTDERDDILRYQEINKDLDVVIENYDDFNSSCAWSPETANAFNRVEPLEQSIVKNSKYCINRYNLGVNRLKVEKLENFQTLTKFIKIVPNDKLDILGYILFPKSVINYSRIINPKTNIKLRAELNKIYFSYNSLLSKNNINLNTLENSHEINAMTLDSMEERDYETFLNKIIPDVTKILENIDTSNVLSFEKILYLLEPYLIYDNNISKNIYKDIERLVKESVTKCKQKMIEQKVENENYIKHNFNVEISKKNLLTNYKELQEIYGINSYKNSEILNYILSLDCGLTLTNFLSLEDLELHSTINVDEISQTNFEDSENPEENKCQNYILTKEYFDMEQLTEDDGKDEIFFDKKYDITHYDLLEEFRLEKDTLEPDEFRNFLFEHLKKNIGMNDKDAMEETAAILLKKRKVQEGQYSIIKEENKIRYFKRNGNQWILDEEIQDNEMGDVFCNLQKKCLKINKKCIDEDLTKSQINKRLLKHISEHFDKDFFLSKEELRTKLTQDLKNNIETIKELKKLNFMKKLKYDIDKLQIGWTLEKSEVLFKSPYEELRDSILGQNDFVKKQTDIILFTNNYCRKEETDNFWYYCIDTNIRLLPTFYKILAEAYKSGNYLKKLNEITRDRGTISDDGDFIVDKHSGYLIREINFDISEGYEDSGFKKISREIEEEDIGKIIARQIISKKEPDSPDVKKIKIVIMKISEEMGIKLEKDHTFIINNVVNSLSKFKNAKNKDKYDRILMIYILAYLLISIVTIIPLVKSKKTFPGCKESFTGFPLNDDDTDIAAVKYLTCVVSKIKSSIGIWRVLHRQKEITIQKNLIKIIKEIVKKKDNIKQRIKLRNEYKEDFELIPHELGVEKWITFLPPLQTLSIPKVRQLGSGFEGSFYSNIKSGNKEQFGQLSEILGKIIYFSLKIQESIQEIIYRENPLLKSADDDPYLENVCCNDGNYNVLQYFIEKDGNIGNDNLQVSKLNKFYLDFKKLSRSKVFYDINDTKIAYPKIENTFEEETIYKAFLHYCDGQEMLMHLCPENLIFENETFDEKVIKLKEEGKNYNNEHLIELLGIIGRNNIIKNEKNYEILHSHQYLMKILEFFESKEDLKISPKLITLLKNLSDSFDVLDWSKEGKEYQQVSDLKNYLIKSNNELKQRLLKFLEDYSSIKKKGKGSFENIKNFIDTIQDWQPRGDNVYMDQADETSFFIYEFLKQATYDIAVIYPSLISNKINYNNVGIPEHWGVSDQHRKILQKNIEEEFNDPKVNILFSSILSESNLDNFLKKIKEETSDLLLLMKRTPAFFKINGVDTIFDSSILKDIGEFYFLTVLNKYIDLEDEIGEIEIEEKEEHISTESVSSDNLGIETRLEMVMGEKEESKQMISTLLISYLNIFIKRKGHLNYNIDTINEIILS